MSKITFVDKTQSAAYDPAAWNAQDAQEIKASVNAAYDAIDLKVDKVTNKSLVSDSEITKLATVAANAQPNASNTVIDSAYVHTDNNYTTVEKNKVAIIGTVANLTTTDKSSLVAAINEVKGVADTAAGGGTVVADGSITNAKLATDVKVGSLAALTTTSKATVVGAVNELQAGKATLNHTHTASNITDFTTAVDARIPAPETGASIITKLGFTPVPTTRQITINGTTLDLSQNRSWTIATNVGSVAWGSITGTLSGQTDLVAALNAKQPTGDYATNTALTSGLAGKANTSHTHTTADITGTKTSTFISDFSTAVDARVTATETGAAIKGKLEALTGVNRLDASAIKNLPTGGGSVNPLAYNVKDFGAVGNGTTDDTTALTNAIIAVGLTGGILIFPPGVYIVTSIEKEIYKSVKISAYGATLKRKDASIVSDFQRMLIINLEAIGISLEIEGLNIDANAIGNPLVDPEIYPHNTSLIANTRGAGNSVSFRDMQLFDRYSFTHLMTHSGTGSDIWANITFENIKSETTHIPGQMSDILFYEGFENLRVINCNVQSLEVESLGGLTTRCNITIDTVTTDVLDLGFFNATDYLFASAEIRNSTVKEMCVLTALSVFAESSEFNSFVPQRIGRGEFRNCRIITPTSPIDLARTPDSNQSLVFNQCTFEPPVGTTGIACFNFAAVLISCPFNIAITVKNCEFKPGFSFIGSPSGDAILFENNIYRSSGDALGVSAGVVGSERVRCKMKIVGGDFTGVTGFAIMFNDFNDSNSLLTLEGVYTTHHASKCWSTGESTNTLYVKSSRVFYINELRDTGIPSDRTRLDNLQWYINTSTNIVAPVWKLMQTNAITLTTTGTTGPATFDPVTGILNIPTYIA